MGTWLTLPQWWVHRCSQQLKLSSMQYLFVAILIQVYEFFKKNCTSAKVRWKWDECRDAFWNISRFNGLTLTNTKTPTSRHSRKSCENNVREKLSFPPEEWIHTQLYIGYIYNQKLSRRQKPKSYICIYASSYISTGKREKNKHNSYFKKNKEKFISVTILYSLTLHKEMSHPLW